MSEAQKITLTTFPDPKLQYYLDYQAYDTPMGRNEKPHIHDSYEIYVNVSGDVAFLVNNSFYPLCKGDVVVTRPGDVHLCVYQSDARHECFCFWFQCPEDSPLIAFTMKSDFSSFIRYSEDTKRELLRLLHRLKDTREAKREPAATAYLFRLLTLFAEGAQTELEHTVLPAELQGVLDYINSNFPQIRCVDDIVTATHISGSTLNRWFRAHLQLSPHKYVEALKLSHAQKLLLEGKSVTEACAGAGFSDCSRFIAVFKSKFGETPLKYRKHYFQT